MSKKKNYQHHMNSFRDMVKTMPAIQLHNIASDIENHLTGSDALPCENTDKALRLLEEAKNLDSEEKIKDKLSFAVKILIRNDRYDFSMWRNTYWRNYDSPNR